MGHIIALFHHGGRFCKGRYVSTVPNVLFEINKDHFSLTELKSYAKDIGYEDVEAFHVEDPATYRFVKLERDSQLSASSEQVPQEENNDFNEFEEETFDCIPEEDDSEIDDELRGFRENLRQKKKSEASKPKKRDKRSSKCQEVELGEAGIDKGFEDIFYDKTTRYSGRLGGDEEFIGSSDEPSEDSDEELDVLPLKCSEFKLDARRFACNTCVLPHRTKGHICSVLE
ncbi:hypothetical protein FXO37_22621 [Capsicum annuum]|nr:hypothetical protein FXO37_22621 [Capsicum annuum]